MHEKVMYLVLGKLSFCHSQDRILGRPHQLVLFSSLLTNLLPSNPNAHSIIEDDYVFVMDLFEVVAVECMIPYYNVEEYD